MCVLTDDNLLISFDPNGKHIEAFNSIVSTSDVFFEGTLSGLRQHLATESCLTMTKNTFCFPLKALLVLKIFKFLS